MNARRKFVAAAIALCAAAPLHAGPWDGTVQLGGTIRNETGDRSTMPETFDLYDGFTVGQLRLNGTVVPGQSLALDLHDLNLRSRRGDVSYTAGDVLRLSGRFDQHRQVYDPARIFDTFRKDWHAGAQLTPRRWLSFTADVDAVARSGDRLRFPAVAPGATPGPALGPLVNVEAFDRRTVIGSVGAEVHHARQGAAVSYQQSELDDGLAAVRGEDAGRHGRLGALRLWAPAPFYDRWQNVVRVAFGDRRVDGGGLEHTYGSFQYTAAVQPCEPWLVRYVFAADRIDDHSLGLRTDRFRNDGDATWFHRYGWLRGGGGYETNDDDRSLTSDKSWNVAGALHDGRWASLKAEYASRVRKDEEQLTLLQDVESQQSRVRLELEPWAWAGAGGSFARRLRDYQDIGVAADGRTAQGFVRATRAGWGNVEADYDWADDDWHDLQSRFATTTRAVTARAELQRVPRVRLACGVTWLEVTRDVRLEKSVLSGEADLQLAAGYRLELQGNVFDFDDYVLLDRYYTANVLRIGLAYDFRSK